RSTGPDCAPNATGSRDLQAHGASASRVDRSALRGARQDGHGEAHETACQSKALGAERHQDRLAGECHVKPFPVVEPPLASYAARHFDLSVEGKVAIVILNRPARKNPLTFDSYAELCSIFRAAAHDDAVLAFVLTGKGGNFSSGGDVHEIIGPLTKLDT